MWTNIKVTLQDSADQLKHQAEILNVDKHELEFLMNRLKETDNEILLHGFKKLLAETKLVYSLELSEHVATIRKRIKDETEKVARQKAQQEQNRVVYLAQRKNEAQKIVNDLYDRYTKGVSSWSKRISRDSALRSILEKHAGLTFTKKGAFLNSKYTVEGVLPDLEYYSEAVISEILFADHDYYNYMY